ncbi:hypothetical protein LCGC14_1981560, partial [marine sediment metagenome]
MKWMIYAIAGLMVLLLVYSSVYTLDFNEIAIVKTFGAAAEPIPGRTDAGLHLKTAGTTWLEELIGLAIAGGDGLDIAREVYSSAFGRFDELCSPYAAVIDIDKVTNGGDGVNVKVGDPVVWTYT